ncbi:MAG TPA: hypothetical protein VH502_16355 [Actinoplanes sp.]
MGSTAKGQANGLATLDATGHVPTGQLPGAGAATVAEAVDDVATADADATYGQSEADLINECKDQINALLASLRTAGLLDT